MQEHPREVRGEYRNPSVGFAVFVPAGLYGIVGDAAGPERSILIPLGEASRIVIYGEPNSQDWASEKEGILWVAALEKNGAACVKIGSGKLGSLPAARILVREVDRVEELLLAFRPGKKSPIYWARLESDKRRYLRDRREFRRIVESFKIIFWE